MADRDGRSPLDADEGQQGEPSIYARLGMEEPGSSRGGAAPPSEGSRSADDLFAPGAVPVPPPSPEDARKPSRDGEPRDTPRDVPALPPGAPETLDLDIESDREAKLTGIALAFLIAAFLLFALSTDSHKHGRTRKALFPSLFPLAPICLTIAGVFGILRAGTRDVHRLYVRRGEIAARTAFFSPGVDRIVYRRGAFRRIVIEEHEKSSKHSRWIEYSIRGVEDYGNIVTLAKERKGREAVAADAVIVAAAMRAGFSG